MQPATFIDKKKWIDKIYRKECDMEKYPTVTVVSSFLPNSRIFFNTKKREHYLCGVIDEKIFDIFRGGFSHNDFLRITYDLDADL